MFQVRIVTVDHYMSTPIQDLDRTYSEFRKSSIKQVPVIRIFGTTPTGVKTCVHVHGVFPYICIPYDGSEPHAKLSCQLAASLDKAINIASGYSNSSTQHVYKIVLVSGIPFYGYHHKKHQFLKVYFYKPSVVKQAVSLLQNGAIMNKIYQPHEAHIPFILQFFIDFNLYGMSFIDFENVKFRKTNYPGLLVNVSPDSLLPETIAAVSCSQYEVDVVAADILNRPSSQGNGVISNPGIAAIWEDEKRRRAMTQGTPLAIAQLHSQRPPLKSTSSELFYLRRLEAILNSASQDNNESSAELLSNKSYAIEEPLHNPALDASFVSLHAMEHYPHHNLIDTIVDEDVALRNSPLSQHSLNRSLALDHEDFELLDVLESLADTRCATVDDDSVLGSQTIRAKTLEEDNSEDSGDDEKWQDKTVVVEEDDPLRLFDLTMPEIDENIINNLMHEPQSGPSGPKQNKNKALIPQVDGASDISYKSDNSRRKKIPQVDGLNDLKPGRKSLGMRGGLSHGAKASSSSNRYRPGGGLIFQKRNTIVAQSSGATSNTVEPTEHEWSDVDNIISTLGKNLYPDHCQKVNEKNPLGCPSSYLLPTSETSNETAINETDELSTLENILSQSAIPTANSYTPAGLQTESQNETSEIDGMLSTQATIQNTLDHEDLDSLLPLSEVDITPSQHSGDGIASYFAVDIPIQSTIDLEPEIAAATPSGCEDCGGDCEKEGHCAEAFISSLMSKGGEPVLRGDPSLYPTHTLDKDDSFTELITGEKKESNDNSTNLVSQSVRNKAPLRKSSRLNKDELQAVDISAKPSDVAENISPVKSSEELEDSTTLFSPLSDDDNEPTGIPGFTNTMYDDISKSLASPWGGSNNDASCSDSELNRLSGALRNGEMEEILKTDSGHYSTLQPSTSRREELMAFLETQNANEQMVVTDPVTDELLHRGRKPIAGPPRLGKNMELAKMYCSTPVTANSKVSAKQLRRQKREERTRKLSLSAQKRVKDEKPILPSLKISQKGSSRLFRKASYPPVKECHVIIEKLTKTNLANVTKKFQVKISNESLLLNTTEELGQSTALEPKKLLARGTSASALKDSKSLILCSGRKHRSNLSIKPTQRSVCHGTKDETWSLNLSEESSEPESVHASSIFDPVGLKIRLIKEETVSALSEESSEEASEKSSQKSVITDSSVASIPRPRGRPRKNLQTNLQPENVRRSGRPKNNLHPENVFALKPVGLAIQKENNEFKSPVNGIRNWNDGSQDIVELRTPPSNSLVSCLVTSPTSVKILNSPRKCDKMLSLSQDKVTHSKPAKSPCPQPVKRTRSATRNERLQAKSEEIQTTMHPQIPNENVAPTSSSLQEVSEPLKSQSSDCGKSISSLSLIGSKFLETSYNVVSVENTSPQISEDSKNIKSSNVKHFRDSLEIDKEVIPCTFKEAKSVSEETSCVVAKSKHSKSAPERKSKARTNNEFLPQSNQEAKSPSAENSHVAVESKHLKSAPERRTTASHNEEVIPCTFKEAKSVSEETSCVLAKSKHSKSAPERKSKARTNKEFVPQSNQEAKSPSAENSHVAVESKLSKSAPERRTTASHNEEAVPHTNKEAKSLSEETSCVAAKRNHSKSAPERKSKAPNNKEFVPQTNQEAKSPSAENSHVAVESKLSKSARETKTKGLKHDVVKTCHEAKNKKRGNRSPLQDNRSPFKRCLNSVSSLLPESAIIRGNCDVIDFETRAECEAKPQNQAKRRDSHSSDSILSIPALQSVAVQDKAEQLPNALKNFKIPKCDSSKPDNVFSTQACSPLSNLVKDVHEVENSNSNLIEEVSSQVTKEIQHLSGNSIPREELCSTEVLEEKSIFCEDSISFDFTLSSNVETHGKTYVDDTFTGSNKGSSACVRSDIKRKSPVPLDDESSTNKRRHEISAIPHVEEQPFRFEQSEVETPKSVAHWFARPFAPWSFWSPCTSPRAHHHAHLFSPPRPISPNTFSQLDLPPGGRQGCMITEGQIMKERSTTVNKSSASTAGSSKDMSSCFKTNEVSQHKYFQRDIKSPVVLLSQESSISDIFSEESDKQETSPSLPDSKGTSAPITPVDNFNVSITEGGHVIDETTSDIHCYQSIQVSSDLKSPMKLTHSFVFTQLHKPPSRQEVFQSLPSLNIPEVINERPFYSNFLDVKGKMEVGGNVLDLTSKSSCHLEEFRSSIPGLSGLLHQQKKIFESIWGHSQVKNGFNQYIISQSKVSAVSLVPVKRPPSVRDVTIWDKARQILLKNVNCKSVSTRTNQNISEEGSNIKSDISSSVLKPENVDLESTLLPTSVSQDNENLSPYLTPVMISAESQQSSIDLCRKEEGLDSRVNLNSSLAQDREPANVLSEKPIEPLSNDSHDESALRQLLANSQFCRDAVSPFCRNEANTSACQVKGTKASPGYKVVLENLQTAKTVKEYQYITVMTVEIHICTCGSMNPDPERDSIRAVFYSVSNDVPSNHDTPAEFNGIIAINDSASITPPLDRCGIDGLVEYATDEKSLFVMLLEKVHRWDPDILCGFEIEMLSWGYVLQRASVLGLNLVKDLSRIPNQKEGKLSDELDDNNGLSGPKITGRIILDVWRLFRSEVALQSYTYENLVYHILHQRVSRHSFSTLSRWWENPTCLYRWMTVRYYQQRVQGVVKLLDQLDIIGRTSELARLFGIQFFEVLSRGSQFRVESMMLRLAKPMNFIPVSPSVQQRAHMKAPECLPLIMEPESRFYRDPLIVLDFQSLYPSMIIAYNYCFSTCLGRIEHLGKSSHFEFGCTELKVKNSHLHQLKDNISVSPSGVAFVSKTVRQGILPRMLEEILEARLAVKQSMKHHKNDPTLQRVLHARQLGLKLIANVTYGYTSANFSGRMPCIEIGDSIVSKGRETLERAISLVHGNHEWRARVVYGDTDSLFVLVPGRSRQEAFRIGEEIASAVTQDNPSPVKLKLEKVYQPSILQTKKRYVGYMYESPHQTNPVYEAKGIETVRRDGCPAVAKMLEKSLRILFETSDVSAVKNYVVHQFTKILSGKANIQDLIFAKEYRGKENYRPGACVPALELAKRWLRNDRRAEPRIGERVPYVIVNGPPGSALINLVRHPNELLTDPSLRYNGVYYVTRAIIPPISRCLSLLGADVSSWYVNLPRRNQVMLPSAAQQGFKKTISQYFTTIECACCGDLTNGGVCEKCRSNPQRLVASLASKIHQWETTHLSITKICQSCLGRSQPLECCSLDCPITYRRHQSSQNKEQSAFVSNLLHGFFGVST